MTRPLILWLALQLAALIIAALGAPLSARYPQPPEQFAIQIMLVAQIAGAALLFPILIPHWRAAILIIAASWPMLQLAGFLSATPAWRILAAAAFLAAWLVLLAVWRNILRTDHSQLIGVALAAALALGGPILWYLSAEFAGGGLDWARHGAAGPIMGALAQIHQPAIALAPWLTPLVLLAITAATLALRPLLGKPPPVA